MALRTPSLQNDNVVAIDREIGSQYDTVKVVADNIDAVKLLGTDEVVAAMTNVLDNVDAILNAADLAATIIDEAETARDEAEAARDEIYNMEVQTGAPGTEAAWEHGVLTIPRGDVGPQGMQGIQGIQGDVGPKGDTGAQGTQGIKGDKGDTGATGLQGIQGIQGIAGPKGDVGDVGPQGPIGLTGPQGAKGDTGSTGNVGPANTLTIGTVSSGGSPSASITGTSPNQILNLVLQQGPQGIQGVQGIKGDTGDNGKGIVSVVKTSGTGAAGTTDVYTITYTDASQSSFNVYNGANGLGSGDMTKATYDTTNNGKVDIAETADKWTTTRTLTVGNTGKTVDGSGNVSWSLAEIGVNNYVHPTADGYLHVPATSTTNNGKVLTAGATAGSLSWQTPSTGVTDHTLLSNIGTNTHSQIDTALTRLINTSGTNTGDQTTITGNAGTATKLQTARTINGVSFDGSADITINAVDSTARQPLDADLTAIAGLVGTSGLLKKTAADTWTLDTAAYTTNLGTVTGVTGTAPIVSSGGAAPAVSLAAGYGDTLNPYASKTANYVLAAPSGSAGVPTFRAITATDIPTLNQNTAGSAATLTTGRTLGITGDMTWTSPSFNGSSNVTAAGTLATVNSNVGSFTNASITVNAKGLVTAASSGAAPVTAVSGTAPIVSSGGTTPAISMAAATASVNGYMTSTYASKLDGIAAGAEVNVNPDWNASSGDAKILNKPTTVGGYGITDAYTKSQVYTQAETNSVVSAHTARVDNPHGVTASQLGLGNYIRADKDLSSRNIANMVYTSGNLTKIQYDTAADINYEVLGYTNGDLTTINHYIGSSLRGTTTLTYTSGSLTSAVFVGV